MSVAHTPGSTPSPESWQSLLRRDAMLKLLPHIATKQADVPVYLIHFVTSQCNARCPHCFIFAPNDPRFAGEALTLEQIERMTRSIGRPIYNVCLTGGETF